VLVASEFGTGQVLWSMIWFTMFFIWIWILISVFSDIFRSHDLSGWSKALWCVFVIFLPYLGVFVYLIARGQKMHEHALEAAKAQDEMMRTYVQQAAGSAASPAEELQKLADLKASGVLSDEEFASMKAKVLNP